MVPADHGCGRSGAGGHHRSGSVADRQRPARTPRLAVDVRQGAPQARCEFRPGARERGADRHAAGGDAHCHQQGSQDGRDSDRGRATAGASGRRCAVDRRRRPDRRKPACRGCRQRAARTALRHYAIRSSGLEPGAGGGRSVRQLRARPARHTRRSDDRTSYRAAAVAARSKAPPSLALCEPGRIYFPFWRRRCRVSCAGCWCVRPCARRP